MFFCCRFFSVFRLLKVFLIDNPKSFICSILLVSGSLHCVIFFACNGNSGTVDSNNGNNSGNGNGKGNTGNGNSGNGSGNGNSSGRSGS